MLTKNGEFGWPACLGRNYLLYLAASSVSSVGNGMQFIAASWLATELTGNAAASAIILICSNLPGVALAPLAGVLADRYERRTLAAAIDLFRAAALLAVPIIFTLGRLEAWHLYLASFLAALGDTIFKPTQSALVREIVPPAQLLRANTTSMIGTQLGMVLGAGSSGLLMTWLHPAAVLLLNALTFLLSALWTVQIVGPGRRPPPTSRYAQDLRLGWLYLRRHPQLAFPYVMALVLASTAQSMNALLVPFVHQTLHLPPSALGIIDGAWAVGAVLAGFALPALTRRFSTRALMTLAPALLSLTLLLGAWAPGFAGATVAWGLMGLFSRSLILYRTAAQEQTQLEYQGRVESAFGVLTSLTFLALYVLLGHTQAIVGPRWLIAAQGVLIGAGSLWAYLTFRTRAGQLTSADVARVESAEAVDP